jgi:hypothetical protein
MMSKRIKLSDVARTRLENGGPDAAVRLHLIDAFNKSADAGRATAHALITAIAPMMADLIRTNTELEARVTEQQERAKELRYVGPWRSGGTYKAGNFVSFNGGLWYTHKDTTPGVRPGSDGSPFQLAVMRGKLDPEIIEGSTHRAARNDRAHRGNGAHGIGVSVRSVAR